MKQKNKKTILTHWGEKMRMGEEIVGLMAFIEGGVGDIQ